MNTKYGLLLNKDAKLHRTYFKEMTKLLGIKVIYRSLKPGMKWTTYGEVDTNYNLPLPVDCIFDGHPNQQTMKKLGWVSELQTEASIIHVPYDLPGLQVGCLFVVPSGLDDGKGRLFRCSKMSNIMIYPASIVCEIVPEYIDTMPNTTIDYRNTSLNLLNEVE